MKKQGSGTKIVGKLRPADVLIRLKYKPFSYLN